MWYHCDVHKTGHFPVGFKGENMNFLSESGARNDEKTKSKTKKPPKKRHIRRNIIIALIAAAVVCLAVRLTAETVCQAEILCCADDGAVLYESHADDRIAPASLTKLLTATTALKYVDSQEIYTVGTEQQLVPDGSSVSFILEGHRLKLYDLITAMLLVSGNDAAYATAVSTARIVSGNEAMSDSEAVDYFCGLMNGLAAEIGMENSHFNTPDGFDSAGQYTTARDLAALAEYALSVQEINEIVRLPEKYVVFESGENITWVNSNLLLNSGSRYYSADAIGMKTGTTPKAGSCLIAAFTKDGKTYISVVSGCLTDSGRYTRTLKLLADYT